MVENKQELSLGELFSQLANDTGTLVRQEVALAKVELTQKAASTGKDVGRLAAGGAIAYAAFLAVMAAVIGLLSYVIPWWAAALIVGIVVGIVGGVMVGNALSALKQTDLTPRQTVETLKEDAQWAREQVK
ncbi:MAG: phage holin family protein [Acidobacteriota bacterium]|nr:phage holin family protein [Acidobacteriota bacterium]